MENVSHVGYVGGVHDRLTINTNDIVVVIDVVAWIVNVAVSGVIGPHIVPRGTYGIGGTVAFVAGIVGITLDAKVMTTAGNPSRPTPFSNGDVN